MNAPNRQPKDRLDGGRFAPTRNFESNVDLVESGTSIAVIDDVVDDRGEDGREPSSPHDFGDGFVMAHQHANGGGWVADTAYVDDSAFVDPDAKVCGRAEVTDGARLEGHAIVADDACVCDNSVVEDSVVQEQALVSNDAQIRRGSVRPRATPSWPNRRS